MKLLIIDPGGLSGADPVLSEALGSPEAPVDVTRTGGTAEAQARLRDDPSFDCLVLSLDAAPADAIATIPGWLRTAPSACLVALSADAGRPSVMSAIRAGAASFIERTGRPDELVRPLRTVVEGGVWLPPPILERRAPDRPGYGTWVPAAKTPEQAGLTRHEARVLRACVAARPTSGIAAETGLGEDEVVALLADLFRRFDAGARLPMVLAVARLGIRLPR